MTTLQRGAMLTAVAAMLAGAVVGCNSSQNASSGGSSSSTVSSSATVATVNGTPISQADFYSQLQIYRPQNSPMGGTSSEPAGIAVLRQMIQTQLIEQLAKKDGVYPTDAQIDQQYQDLKTQNDRNNVKSLDDQLAQNGLTPDSLKKNQITPQLCQILELTKGITVTDADVKAYYDLHKKDQFSVPAQAHIKRIVCSTQADAQALFTQLQKGGTWDEAYNSPKSMDKSMVGGDFTQWINQDLNNPQAKPLLDAIKATDVGKYAGPFKLGNGYWVIQVVDKRPSQDFPLDKVQDLVRNQLLQQKALSDPSKSGAFQEAMRNQSTAASIEVTDAQYKPLVQQITNPPAPAPQMMGGPPQPGGPRPGGPGAPRPGAPAPAPAPKH